MWKVNHLSKQRVKKLPIRICHICNKEIFPDQEPDPIYIKTKRKIEIWIHRKCFKSEDADNACK